MIDRDPWDKQPGEGPKPFEAFTIYRDLGPARSAGKVAEQSGKSRALMERWSRQHAWVTRAGAWDAYLDRERRLTAAAERRAMDDRHAQVARLAMSKLGAALMDLPERMTPGDIARLLDVAASFERTARGGVDLTVAHTGPGGGPIEVSTLSDEERRARLQQLMAEAAARLTDTTPTDAGFEDDGDDDETPDRVPDTSGGLLL